MMGFPICFLPAGPARHASFHLAGEPFPESSSGFVAMQKAQLHKRLDPVEELGCNDWFVMFL